MGENWRNVSHALRVGARGLPGGSSLAQLLNKHRSVRNKGNAPQLSEKQILRWAKAFRRAQDRWPIASSGPIAESPDDTWSAVDQALRHGRRGLKGGSSLSKLLKKRGPK